MNSIEKIQQLAGEYGGPPPGDAEPLELVIRSAAMTVGPMFLELLPDDAGQVDTLIEEMAERLLSLRSDPPAIDAHAEQVALDGPPVHEAQ